MAAILRFPMQIEEDMAEEEQEEEEQEEQEYMNSDNEDMEEIDEEEGYNRNINDFDNGDFE